MVKAKVYIFEKHFKGFPKASDLKLIEEELPPIKTGEFLAEAVYISVDPYQRVFSKYIETGKTFIGSQVAKIIESQHPGFPVGKFVVGEFGWRTHTISSGKDETSFPDPWILPDFGKLPKSLALGILGMPGNSAYFGFLEICKPKAGETVVITAAAGAVGNVVGQIAKIKGCKVIGIAGSDSKLKWLLNDLKFDHVINYKTTNVDKALQEIAPEGIDCYFDNVGGELSCTIMSHMKTFGRISLCGGISEYNCEQKTKITNMQMEIIFKQLKIEGFVVHRWTPRWLEGIEQNLKWINEGKMVYRETVVEGFENMLTALIELFEGKNTGKMVVKL